MKLFIYLDIYVDEEPVIVFHLYFRPVVERLAAPGRGGEVGAGAVAGHTDLAAAAAAAAPGHGQTTIVEERRKKYSSKKHISGDFYNFFRQAKSYSKKARVAKGLLRVEMRPSNYQGMQKIRKGWHHWWCFVTLSVKRSSGFASSGSVRARPHLYYLTTSPSSPRAPAPSPPS